MFSLLQPQAVRTFCDLFHGAREAESLVFFTDPHLFQKGECGEAEMYRRAEYCLSAVRDVFDAVPADIIIGGGDWLGSHDTVSEAKCKLAMIDGCMRRLFGEAYYPILGNHDTAYQGVDENGEQLGVDRGLSAELLTELCFRRFGRPYYSFTGKHTRFFVLDSQLDWNADRMTPYKWAQIGWLAEALTRNENRHNVIALHMWWWNMRDDPPAAMVTVLTDLILAYNRKESFACGETVYDFRHTDGRIEFVMSGHSHDDWETRVGDCPVFATTLLRGDLPTFDLMYADYDAHRLHCVRVGDGDSREFDLSSGERL